MFKRHYKLTLPLAVELISKWKTAEAETLQRYLYEIRRAIERWPMIAALKVLTEYMPGHDQWTHLRPPLSPLLFQDAQACIQSYEAARKMVSIRKSHILSA